MSEAVNVCVLAYEGLNTFAYGIALEVFGTPNQGVMPWYNCKTVAFSDGALHGQSGITIQPSDTLDALDGADMIIVPGWNLDKIQPSDALKSKIQDANARGVRLVSVGSGAFLLAACGVVDGKQVAVHPEHLEDFRKRFPNVDVHSTSVYVESGNVVTAAGQAAGIDMGLYIAKQDFGAKAANRVARRLVVPTYRDGQQAQFVARSLPIHASGHIGTILEELRENLDKDWDIKSLSKLANTSPRTLQRRFKDATGQSPQVWLIHERIELAKELLETSNMNIQQIADVSGMKTPETFRHHFKRIVGVNPTQYRSKLNQGRRRHQLA